MSSDKPNTANTKISGGTTKETNPPKAPNSANNSSTSYQNDGSSIPKLAQGVVANTVISINNSIPAHGCDIKLPLLSESIQTKFKKYFETETKNLENFTTWISTNVISPIVETIKNAVKAIKARIKQVQKYINKIKKIVKDMQEFIQSVQELIAFVMTLPSRLLQLIANCMTALQTGLTDMIKSAVTANSEAASASIDNATKTIPAANT